MTGLARATVNSANVVAPLRQRSCRVPEPHLPAHGRTCLLDLRRSAADSVSAIPRGLCRTGHAPTTSSTASSDNVPGDVSIPNRAMMNLLELPVLFYVVCLMFFVANRVDMTVIEVRLGLCRISPGADARPHHLQQRVPPADHVRDQQFRAVSLWGCSSCAGVAIVSCRLAHASLRSYETSKSARSVCT